MSTWLCPFCTAGCVPYGTKCDDPEACPHEKNIHYANKQKRQHSNEPGVGISEISNESEYKE